MLCKIKKNLDASYDTTEHANYCKILQGCDVHGNMKADTTVTPKMGRNMTSLHDKKKSQMEKIISNQRDMKIMSVEATHHEAVMDPVFHFKFPHSERNDSCFDEMRLLTTTGFEANLRSQLDVFKDEKSLYVDTMLAVSKVRKHLCEMHLHLNKSKIMSILSDKNVDGATKKGVISWSFVLRLLRTMIYAMRFSVGSDVARDILYKQRLHGREQGHNDTVKVSRQQVAPRVFSDSTCAKEEHYFISKPRAYNRLMEDVAQASRGGSQFDLGEVIRKDDAPKKRGRNNANSDMVRSNRHATSTDGANYALDEQTYIDLMSMVYTVENADSTKSSRELGSIFCDMLFRITSTMDDLDVLLNNATISATRMSAMDVNVKKEQNLVARWFEDGLGVHNTVKWLRSQVVENRKPSYHLCGVTSGNLDGARSGISRLIYSGYVSMIMAPGSQEIDEVDYPELMVLDIEYIQRARGVIYGQVAQATVLVIIGQRLTQAGISSKSIHACIGGIVLEPDFILLGNAQTLRGQPSVVDKLLSACSTYLQQALSSESVPQTHKNVLQAILCEIAREVTHGGYPSSPIALSIAEKWTTATFQACLETPGDVCVVHDAFSTPEATRAAFSSSLLLPKAAHYMSRDFHFSTLDIVKRAAFNVAVHYERYREIVSIL